MMPVLDTLGTAWVRTACTKLKIKPFSQPHPGLRMAIPHVSLLLLLFSAAEVGALDIATLSGRKFKDCHVLEVQADRVRIMHTTGVTSIDLDDLSNELRKQYHYDPAKAVQARRERVEKERGLAVSNAANAQTLQPTVATQTPRPNTSASEQQRAAADHIENAAQPPPESAEETQSLQPKPAAKDRQVVLAALWDTKMQGGSATMGDLQTLFSSHASPGTVLTGSSDLILTANVPYLCPLDTAKALLKVAGKLTSKAMIACPGFPRDSVFYHSFDGHFEGGYNRMYVVVDRADQVVSIAMVEESPRSHSHLPLDSGWTCYNFVNYRVKAAPRLRIAHEVRETSPDVFKVDSELWDPEPRRVLERSRWYVSRPFVQLILHCISKG